MAHMVFCVRYKKEMEGLDEPPFDSEFGQKIYKNVSKVAWDEWVNRQKMLLERVSPPALAAAGAAVSRRADGRVFLRLRLGHALAVRPAVAMNQFGGINAFEDRWLRSPGIGQLNCPPRGVLKGHCFSRATKIS